MEIFNIGLGEIILIFIIALLVFGPERLPELARQTGRFFNQVRGMADEVQRAIMTETQTITNPLEETRQEITSLSAPFKDVKKTLSEPLIAPQSAKPTSTALTVPKAGAEQAKAYDAPDIPITEGEPSSTPAQPVIEMPTYKPVSRNGDQDG